MAWRLLPQTLAVGAAGAAVAYGLQVPAGFLLGPAAAVSAAALAGLRVDMPDVLRNAGFILVGLGMGSGVTPDVLAAAARWPLSLVALLLSVAVILWGGGWMLRRVLGLDRRTAVLAAAPGHLSFVLGLGMDVKADLPLLTVIQSLRVLALTLLTPPLVVLLQGEALPPGLPPSVPMALPLLAAACVVAAGVGWGLSRLAVPAGMLIGAMTVSAVGHGTGLTPGGVPPWAAIPGLVVMGSLIGTRFSGVRLSLIRRAFLGAMMLTGLAVAVAAIAAWVTARLLGLSLISALIAFAPGGVETMVAMSLMLGADPAYVALHHVVRLFALTALIPLALGRGL